MADKRLRTKLELKRLFTNLRRKGITDNMMSILIDVLWRKKPNLRSSGFDIAGGPDAVIEWDNDTLTFSIYPLYYDGSGSGSGGADSSGSGSGSGDDYVPRFIFYAWAGEAYKIRKYTEESITIPDEEGLYVFYYDQGDSVRTQELQYLKNPDSDAIEKLYLRDVIISWVYWDSTNKDAIYFGDERHGSEWTPSINWWSHSVFGMLREYGLRSTDIVIGDGSQNYHAQVGISAGNAFHEDMQHEAEAVESTTGIPILYTSANGKRIIEREGFPVTGAAGQRLYYNEEDMLKEADEGAFLLCHIFFTNCSIHPFIAVMPRAQYDEAIDAISGAREELEDIDGWIPHQAKMLVTTLVLETSSDFGNSVQARIVSELTPEGIADIVTKDNLPTLKTGWNPLIQEHYYFDYSEVLHELSLRFLSGVAWTTYFVAGVKYKLENSFSVGSLPARLGMNYVTSNGSVLDKTALTLDNHTRESVIIAAMYRNPRQGQTPYFGWRMHTWEMDGHVRGNIIEETGLEYVSGFLLSINASNSHELDVSDGVLRLAELIANVTHNSGLVFGQSLRSLQARRYYLKTYTDGAEPTHEWEYQDSPAANVALLSGSNVVQINELVDGEYVLNDTFVGEYTVMWLLATLDYSKPLKLITGVAASDDKEEAKQLNSTDELKSLIDGADFITDHPRLLGRVVIKNIADYPYYELVEIEELKDVDLDDLDDDLYVESGEYDADTFEVVLHRTGGLSDIRISLWELLFGSTSDGSGSGSGGADGSGSGSGGADGSGSGTSGNLLDNYIVAVFFDEATRTLTLRRMGDLPDLEVYIPDEDDDNYVDAASAVAQSTGTVPSVSNTNNIVKLLFERTGSLADLEVILGSMAALKFWTGTQAQYDALGSYSNDTLYHILEE